MNLLLLFFKEEIVIFWS